VIICVSGRLKIAQAFKPGITINIKTRARFSGRQILECGDLSPLFILSAEKTKAPSSRRTAKFQPSVSRTMLALINSIPSSELLGYCRSSTDADSGGNQSVAES